MQINSTEAAGLLAFVPAALASAAASARPGAGRKWWGVLALLYVLLTLEILMSTRHLIDGAIREWLRADGVYFNRRPTQVAAVLIVTALGLVTDWALVGRAPTRPLKIATGASAAVVTLFLLESVSLHYMDAVLYRTAGPVLVIGWLWLLGGWCVAAAAARHFFDNSASPT